MRYPQFTNKAVEDLAWVITSPSLLVDNQNIWSYDIVSDDWCLKKYEKIAGWLQKLDKNPRPLLDFLKQQETRRLGLYFENLITFWLSHDPDFELHGNHLQVYSGNETVGEFDYIFSYQKQLYHWETAVKFFLLDGEPSDWSAYIGPNAVDTLAKKANKTFHQQLCLSEKEPGKEKLLELLGSDQEPIKQAFFKGYLFYPLEQIGNIPNVDGISNNHLHGWWYHYESNELTPTHEDSYWVILPRLAWLGQAHMHMDSTRQTRTLEDMQDLISEKFDNHPSAQLLVELVETKGGQLEEVSRGFVVPSEWPQIG